MIAIGKQNKINILKEINYIHSLGHFYSAITVVCGFRAIRDEGKITSLSAKGKINYNLLNTFKKLIKVTKDGTIYSELNKDLYLGPYPHTLFREIIKKLKKITTGVSKNDICKTTQTFTEKIVLKLVNFYQKKYGIYNLCLAGGIFSNVLINKRLYETNYTKKIYVHPGMTDTGLALGPYSIAEEYRAIAFPLDNMSNMSFSLFLGLEKVCFNLLISFLLSFSLIWS